MNVSKELRRLQRLSLSELREVYAQVFKEPTRSGNRSHLIRRILWKKQALLEGDLSQRARRRAAELAKDSDMRLTGPRQSKSVVNAFKPRRDPRLPLPGAILTRQYRGEELKVTVLEEGFLFQGETFKTLSAIARFVTKSHTSGPRFFGLTGKGKRNGR